MGIDYLQTYKNPNPHKSLEEVELNFDTDINYLPYRIPKGLEGTSGLGHGVTIRIKTKDGKVRPEPFGLFGIYAVIQNEFILRQPNDEEHNKYKKDLLQKYWDRFLDQVISNGELTLVEKAFSAESEFPKDYIPVNSLKIFLETLLDNMGEFVCALVYFVTVHKMVSDFLDLTYSFDLIYSWEDEIFSKKDNILDMKIDNMSLNIIKDRLQDSIQIIYEEYINGLKMPFESPKEKLDYNVETIFKLVDIIMAEAVLIDDHEEEMKTQICTYLNNIPEYSKLKKKYDKQQAAKEAKKAKMYLMWGNGDEKSKPKLSFDLTDIPTMSNDGSKPLTQLERMYIKNEDAIKVYEKVFFEALYRCQEEIGEETVFEYSFNLDYLDGEFRENLKTLFNNSPYASDFEDWHINDLNNDKYYELFMVGDLMWDEFYAYGADYETEEGKELLDKMLLVIILMGFHLYDYKMEGIFNVGDLPVKVNKTLINKLKKIKPNYNIPNGDIRSESRRADEALDELFDSIDTIILANQDIVNILLERFRTETGGELVEEYITKTMYLPSKAVKVIIRRELQNLAYVDRLEKYGIKFAMSDYFNDFYNILLDSM